MSRALAGLGVDEEDLAAWRAASGLTIAALAGVALTADALLLLGAQCIASAALATDDLANAVARSSDIAWEMRQRMDGPAPAPVRILSIEEDGDDA